MQIVMARAGRKRTTRMHLSNPVPKIDYRALCGEQPHRRGLPEELRLAAEAVTPFGRLFLAGALNKPGDPECAWRRHEAGKAYANIVQGYLSSIGAPRGEFPQGKGYPCSGSPQCGQGELEPPCECRKRKREYDEAFEALAEAGHRAQVEVAHVAVQGRPCGNLAYLCIGLDALVRQLLTQRPKNAPSRNM